MSNHSLWFEASKIFDVKDVKGDGNCFYRSAAISLGKEEDNYESLKNKLDLYWCTNKPKDVTDHVINDMKEQIKNYKNSNLEKEVETIVDSKKTNADKFIALTLMNGTWVQDCHIPYIAKAIGRDIIVFRENEDKREFIRFENGNYFKCGQKNAKRIYILNCQMGSHFKALFLKTEENEVVRKSLREEAMDDMAAFPCKCGEKECKGLSCTCCSKKCGPDCYCLCNKMVNLILINNNTQLLI